MLLELDEGRRLAQPHPDEQGEEDQRERGEERHAPSPAQQLVLGEQRDQPEDDRGEQGSGLDADERQGGEEPAALDRRVLGHQHGRARLLGTGTEALEEAHQHQQDRGPEPDRLVGGQQTDRGRCPAHQDDRGDQDPLAPELSPRTPKNRPPNGRARKPTPKVANAATVAMAGSSCGKNRTLKINAVESPLEREVEVLERAADAGRERRAAQIRRVLRVIGHCAC